MATSRAMGGARLPLLVSAPGKVILHGEHAVVYGKTALVAAVDLRTYLLVLPRKDEKISVEMQMIGFSCEWSKEELLQLSECNTDGVGPQPPSQSFLETVHKHYGLDETSTAPSVLATIGFLHLVTRIFRDQLRCVQGLHFFITSKLPVSAGLGSSATFAVCLAAGLLKLKENLQQGSQPEEEEEDGQEDRDCCGTVEKGTICTTNASSSDTELIPTEVAALLEAHSQGSCAEVSKKNYSASTVKEFPTQQLDSINEWAFQCEKLIHGTPSGVDNCVSCFGGVIKYSSGRMLPITNLPSLRILLANTRVSRSSKALVAEVQRRFTACPSVMEPMFDSVQAISEQCEVELQQLAEAELRSEKFEDSIKESYRRIGELIDMNHHLLCAMGVGHKAIDTVRQVASEHGFPSKLTGAGGGGCAFCLIVPGGEADSKVEVCRQELAEHAFHAWETKLGCRGVMLHNLDII